MNEPIVDPGDAPATDSHAPRPTPAGGDPTAHWLRRGIVLLILAGGLLGLFLYFEGSDHAPRAVAAVANPGPLPVRIRTLEARTVSLAPRFLGQAEASQVVEIRSRISGFLLERTFDEGTPVAAGQTLFRVDREPFEIELQSAKAALSSAEARLEQARQQLRRYEELFERGSVAPNELEEWVTTERVAAAQVAQETARIAKAQLDLGYTTIGAPIVGLIGRTLKDAGTYVDDMTDPLLAVLQQVDPIYVRYAVSEQELLRWQRLSREGQVVSPPAEELTLSVTLADGTRHPHEGHIKFVDVALDPSTGTTVVRGTVPNPDHALRPGQFVHVTVHGLDRIDVLAVPQSAVLQTAGGPIVYVVAADGHAVQRPLELGDWIGDEWIVESGLAPGERIVADRLMHVRPGSAVVAADDAAGSR
jgi:membrane fusion protein (multidrug efflux system)